MTTDLRQPADYDRQLADKQQQLQARLAAFDAPALEVFASTPNHYRMRAEFRVWHEGDDLYYIMFDQATKQRYRVDQFPAGSTLINALMTRLLDGVRPEQPLRHKLFQVDFLTTQSGEALISLLYHKRLDAHWQAAARALRETLRNEGWQVELIGRALKQKIVLDRDYVTERLQVGERTLSYRQVENSFTQPNAMMNEQMLGWACDVSRDTGGDLLELYCGNGNFSLALAPQFRQVLATEIAKSSVDSAQHNIAINQVDNVRILRMSAEEFTQALRSTRTFQRLDGVDLASYDCRTILVDPPRAGLDPATLNLVQEYEFILYISCNPDTLCDNLAQLTQTHRIARCALFDQFPFTHHMESGVWLQRR